MKTAGWIVWCISLFLAVSTITSTHRLHKQGKSFNYTLPSIAFIMLISLAAFLFLEYSKLHLIWIYFAVTAMVGRIFLLKKPELAYQILLSMTHYLLGENKADKRPGANFHFTTAELDKIISSANSIEKDVATMAGQIISGGIFFINELKKLRPLKGDEDANIYSNIVLPFFIHLHDRILFSRFGDKVCVVYIEPIVEYIYNHVMTKSGISMEAFKSVLNSSQLEFSKYSDIITKGDNLSNNLMWYIAKTIAREMSNAEGLHYQIYMLLVEIYQNFSVHKINAFDI